MQTPEEQELRRKRARLATLEGELAQRELELLTLQGELRAFEARYLGTVGVRYAALDALAVQIAEAQARRTARDSRAREHAAHARAQAQESAEATHPSGSPEPPTAFTPSEELKKLYREAAKFLHPDLAIDAEDRVRRTRLMAEANRAYEHGDEARLRAILREWAARPETVKGEGEGADLVRVIRKIAQLEARLRAIEEERTHLKASEL